METSFEDLRVLQIAEGIADGFWRQVVEWESFAREVVRGQLARAADSVGANIAESFDHFHYGEKLQFLYYPVEAYSKPNIGLTERWSVNSWHPNKHKAMLLN
jgi:hypothetical protein